MSALVNVLQRILNSPTHDICTPIGSAPEIIEPFSILTESGGKILAEDGTDILG